VAKTKMTVGVNLDGDAKGFQKAASDAARSTKGLENQIRSTKIGRIWDDVSKGVKGVISAMGTLKGAIMATGIGALVIAVTGLVNWFKKTETGADLLAKGQKILGQAIKEGPMIAFNALKTIVLAVLIPMRTFIATAGHMINVIKGKESLKEAIQGIKEDVKSFGQDVVDSAQKIGQAAGNIAKASALADKWDALDDARRDRKKTDAALEKEIAQAREEASEQIDNAAKKVQLLQQAQALLAKQNSILKKDKEDEIALIKEELALYPDNQEWIEKLATAQAELEDIDTQYADAKRAINKQLITGQKQLTKEQQEEIDKQNAAKQEQLEKEKALVDQRLANEARMKDEVDALQKEIQLLKADGYIKEAILLQQAYDKELSELGNNEEAKKLLWEKYRILNKQLFDKQKEEAKAAQEEQAEVEKQSIIETEEEKLAIYMASAQAISNLIGIASDIYAAQKDKELKAAGNNAKKKEEIEKKYAKKQQAIAIAQTIINGAIAFTKALDGPPILKWIEAGLVAASTIAQVAIIKSQKFAKGGLVYGQTLATVGEYANAGSNPEVIAPLSKLKSLIGENTGQVTFRIEGDALVGVLNKYERKQLTYR